jgi:hypothetical protein
MTSTCSICHATKECPYDAFPLLNDSKCCPSCHLFVKYAKTNPCFVSKVKDITQTFHDITKDMMSEGGARRLLANVVGLDNEIHLGVVSKFATVPEKHYLQYACGVRCYFDAVARFVKDRFLGANDGIFTADCDDKTKRNVIGSIGSALMASLSTEASTKYPTFLMRSNGAITASLLIKFGTDDDEYTGAIIKLNYFSEKPLFVIHTLKMNADPYEIPLRFVLNEGAKCEAIHFADSDREPIEYVDDLWLKQLAHKKAKEAKKEQELKEQERKERKEREREEQRLYAIKQRDEEIALRAARATLVVAVAEVDTQLEAIRKLRELNREVALKNQRLADRKEADRLANEAEKRHAEKLKQKELERQKFVSKKN